MPLGGTAQGLASPGPAVDYARMQLPFLMPMFDSGPDYRWAVAVLAVVGSVVGMLWMRHNLQGEGEYGSFRATRHGESRAAVVAVGLTVAALAALLVVPLIASAIRL